MVNYAHILHKLEKRKIAFFFGDFWALNYLKHFHWAHIFYILFLSIDRYQEFMNAYFFQMENLNFTMGNDKLRTWAPLGVGAVLFLCFPVPIVVPGTYQVPSKCFLSEYLMNVSEKNNNNAGCEQSSAKLSAQNFILSQWFQVLLLIPKCLMFKIMFFLKFCMISTRGYHELIHCDFIALSSL